MQVSDSLNHSEKATQVLLSRWHVGISLLRMSLPVWCANFGFAALPSQMVVELLDFSMYCSQQRMEIKQLIAGFVVQLICAVNWSNWQQQLARVQERRYQVALDSLKLQVQALPRSGATTDEWRMDTVVMGHDRAAWSIR